MALGNFFDLHARDKCRRLRVFSQDPRRAVLIQLILIAGHLALQRGVQCITIRRAATFFRSGCTARFNDRRSHFVLAQAAGYNGLGARVNGNGAGLQLVVRHVDGHVLRLALVWPQSLSRLLDSVQLRLLALWHVEFRSVREALGKPDELRKTLHLDFALRTLQDYAAHAYRWTIDARLHLHHHRVVHVFQD